MRLAKQVEVHDLAVRIGVGLNSYYRFENGTRPIHLHKAWALADYLGCKLEELRHDPDLTNGTGTASQGIVVAEALGDWAFDAEPA